MATNDSVRANRLRALVLDEKRAIERYSKSLRQYREAADSLARGIATEESVLAARLEKFDDRLRKLDEWREEPVVIVRSTAGGYGMPVYHDAERPCGYGSNMLAPRKMLLAEAEELGHTPCSACGWIARRRRLAVAA